MNTQNSQTAATPTAGTWFKNLSLEQLRTRRTQHMRLTELENLLIEMVTEDYADDALILQWAGLVAEAGLLTRQMITNGFINTPATYELAMSVQDLSGRVNQSMWETFMPECIPALESLQQQSAEILARHALSSENVL